MIQRELIQGLEPILSGKEIEVVLKRLDNRHITQTESNYLARSVRPKLRSAEFAASIKLLSLLDYRRKRYEREDSLLREKIVTAVQSVVKDIRAIAIFGSYVRNSHANYRDIDVMVVLNKRIWKSSAEKNRLKREIEDAIGLKTDVKPVVYRELVSLLPYSPLLQSELEDHKVIYGSLKLKKKLIIDKSYLYRKLLEAEYVMELGKSIKPRYIYNALRNCLAISLYLKKAVDNKLIIRTIEDNIGKSTAEGLLDDKASMFQKEIALKYLKHLYNGLKKAIR